MTVKIHWPFVPSVETQNYDPEASNHWKLTGFDHALQIYSWPREWPHSSMWVVRVRSLEDARLLLAEARVRGFLNTYWRALALMRLGRNGRLGWRQVEGVWL